eukprot:4212656-Alexandrium_andersonii.AAC.1
MEEVYKKEGLTARFSRVSLHSVVLRTIHDLGMALRGIVAQLKTEPTAGVPGGTPATAPRGEAAA